MLSGFWKRVNGRDSGHTVRRLCETMIVAFFPATICAQLEGHISQFRNWSRFEQISQFYQLHNYEFAWVNRTNIRNELLHVLNLADSFGLNRLDYQHQFSDTYSLSQNLRNLDDSINADVHFTEASIHFFSDLKFGSRVPSFGYTGLSYNPADNSDISSLLAAYSNNSINDLVCAVQPKTIEYASLLKKLNWLRKIVNDKNFVEARIISKNADETNKPLLIRLYQLGITDSVLKTSDRKIIIEKLRKAQSSFDLLNDGTLRSTALQAFNIPLKHRIEEIKIALNYLRWTEQIKQTSTVLLLNIPSAYLMVYDNGKMILDSKVIVGKPATPTPTLTSTITHVVLYPFWNVPHKIATKELLPSIKRNIGFLEEGNYQVLNDEGKVLNPYSINWKSLSTRYFPYHIRQSTGCDNALGIVKFSFYNPFSVYLHDTPNKGLFSFNKRYFSHGCMRVEKPIELAHLLLSTNRIAIDTLTAKGCLRQQAPKTIAVEKELPVIILYSTVWYNKEGEVCFYDDVYGKLKQ